MSLATAFWCVLIGLFLWAKMYSYERALFAPDKASATYWLGKPTENDGSANDRIISGQMRQRVILRDRGICQYTAASCVIGGDGPDALHVDHVIPDSWGAPEDLWNLVVSTKEFNQLKSNLWFGPSVDLLRVRGETVFMTEKMKRQYWFPRVYTKNQLVNEMKRRGI